MRDIFRRVFIMDKKVNDLMDEELTILMKALEGEPTDSEKYKEITERIETLSKVANERAKTMNDIDIKNKDSKRYWIDKTLDGIKLGVEITGIVAPLLFYKKWMMLGFKWEEEGSITSQTFKQLIGKFKPHK